MAEQEEGKEAGEVDFSQKHPLENRWTLWFDNPNGRVNNKTWGQTLRSVYTFSTVEEFWWCVRRAGLALVCTFGSGGGRSVTRESAGRNDDAPFRFLCSVSTTNQNTLRFAI